MTVERASSPTHGAGVRIESWTQEVWQAGELGTAPGDRRLLLVRAAPPGSTERIVP